MARRKPAPIAHYEELCEFYDATLICVVTLSEACYMWGKSETAVRTAMYKHQIQGRKPITGGDWLISRVSLVNRWGEPKKDLTCQLLK
jgi:hypothetical protein